MSLLTHNTFTNNNNDNGSGRNKMTIHQRNDSSNSDLLLEGELVGNLLCLLDDEPILPLECNFDPIPIRFAVRTNHNNNNNNNNNNNKTYQQRPPPIPKSSSSTFSNMGTYWDLLDDTIKDGIIDIFGDNKMMSRNNSLSSSSSSSSSPSAYASPYPSTSQQQQQQQPSCPFPFTSPQVLQLQHDRSRSRTYSEKKGVALDPEDDDDDDDYGGGSYGTTISSDDSSSSDSMSENCHHDGRNNNGGTTTTTTTKPSMYKFEAKWMKRYKSLLQYKQTYGNCCVPTSWKPDPALSSWVKRQRYQYRMKYHTTTTTNGGGNSTTTTTTTTNNNNNYTTMTFYREELLNQLNFIWNVQDAKWEERWNELIQFRNKHGHCKVPLSYTENPELAIWAKCQRRHYMAYRAHIANGKKWTSNKMNPERIQKLEQVGFVFKNRN